MLNFESLFLMRNWIRSTSKFPPHVWYHPDPILPGLENAISLEIPAQTYYQCSFSQCFFKFSFFKFSKIDSSGKLRLNTISWREPWFIVAFIYCPYCYFSVRILIESLRLYSHGKFDIIIYYRCVIFNSGVLVVLFLWYRCTLTLTLCGTLMTLLYFLVSMLTAFTCSEVASSFNLD